MHWLKKHHLVLPRAWGVKTTNWQLVGCAMPRGAQLQAHLQHCATSAFVPPLEIRFVARSSTWLTPVRNRFAH